MNLAEESIKKVGLEIGVAEADLDKFVKAVQAAIDSLPDEQTAGERVKNYQMHPAYFHPLTPLGTAAETGVYGLLNNKEVEDSE